MIIIPNKYNRLSIEVEQRAVGDDIPQPTLELERVEGIRVKQRGRKCMIVAEFHKPFDIEIDVKIGNTDRGCAIYLDLKKLKKVENSHIKISNYKALSKLGKQMKLMHGTPFVIQMKVSCNEVHTIATKLLLQLKKEISPGNYHQFSVSQEFHICVFMPSTDPGTTTFTQEIICSHDKLMIPRLKSVQVPQVIEEFLEPYCTGPRMNDSTKKLFDRRYRIEGVTIDNYQEFFGDLLFMEQWEMETLMEKHTRYLTDVPINILKERVIILNIPDLTRNGEAVAVPEDVTFYFGESRTDYRGKVLQVLENTVIVGKLQNSLVQLYEDHCKESECPLKMDVDFGRCDFGIKVKMFSLEHVCESPRFQDLLFPTDSRTKKRVLPTVKLFNTNMENNLEQKTAVLNILAGSSKPGPYIIFGPAGTGKTSVLVEAILQVLAASPVNKVLVCTPSNCACDNIASIVLECLKNAKMNGAVELNDANVLRYIAKSRIIATDIPYTNKVCCIDSATVTFSTLTTIGNRRGLGEIYSHVFVDEAGQTLECEALIAMVNLRPRGQLILAGDPKQLGPICISSVASDYGLGRSLLERLIDTVPLYKSNAQGEYDNRFITLLKDNYRCHPQILSLPNRLFYQSMLRSKHTTDTLSDYCFKTGLSQGGSALLFHGVLGEEMKNKSSYSYYNRDEITQVVGYIGKLLDPTFPILVKQHEIGVVTPYKEQMSRLRDKFSSLGWENIDVGSAEVFQGQERRVIIVSTVRSQKNFKTPQLGFVKDKRRFNVILTRARSKPNRFHMSLSITPQLGFVKDKRRFNVILTRARSKCIVVGNPILLYTDQTWKQLVEEAVKENRYLGVPVKIKNSVIAEDTATKIPGALTSQSSAGGNSQVNAIRRLVHGVCGTESLANDSKLSFYNDSEIHLVVTYVENILAGNFRIPLKAEEVGIISPYPEQVFRIRAKLSAIGHEKIVVGTPELFGGIAKRLVIVSTVRSQEHNKWNRNFRFDMGLLGNRIRFGIMLTSASEITILIGNPILLASDAMWKKAISDAVDGKYYKGIPIELQRKKWIKSTQNLSEEVHIDCYLSNLEKETEAIVLN